MSRLKLVLAAATVASLSIVAAMSYAVRPGLASDHQDTLRAVAKPGADITDMYVFPAKDPRDVVFALDVHPLVPRGLAATASFDPGVLYQIKIDTVGDYREHVVLQFKAEGAGTKQRIIFSGPVAAIPGTISTMLGKPLGTTTYGVPVALPGGIRLFAGPRKDPFYFDLTQFFKIDPDRNFSYHPKADVPPASATCFRTPGIDYFASFNVLSIVVEMPRATLTNARNHGRINVWATPSVSQPTAPGVWRQIERWGRPAVKEALEPFALHAKTNHAEPYDDPTLAGAIFATMRAPKPVGAGRSAATANALVRVLVPDEMQVNLAATGHATYLGVETKGLSGLPTAVNRVVPDAGLEGLKSSLRNGARQFGGRDPDSPVIDISLGAIYGSTISKIGLAHDDHAETACLTSDGTKPSHATLDGFPYLPEPI
ncbi:MAG: DUF4331 family protein [Candidatus Eremiobacteraeota bacterium]|nr:DUF4331 family protein [Candidatus Eremiobacteraeota bacterium]